MIEQRKKEIDGGTTTESAFLGYLAIMLFYKSEDSYRGIENTRLAYTPLTSSAMQVKGLLQWVASAALQVKGLLQWFASQVKGLLRGALPTGKPYLVKGLRMEARVTFRSSLTTVCKKDSALGSLLSLRGVADDVLSFGDVPPDLSFEDLERTFPRFSSLEGLAEYRV
ncbi:uncharacterized protein DS421_19g655500 [Arachis hypogaea]|uniref:Uncharacterized protein n=1 Tax=Arachis hypogaea TaxID=3818 RepID=A0A6B9V9Q4_ARAHY|nr:uncharacterized protein DS421_19g655500 [Arachis hypogaea]